MDLILNRSRINKYCNECFDIMPTDEQVLEIITQYDKDIDEYGYLYENDIIEIIGNIVLQ